ncbi:MAG: glycosyltransferase [Oscillospiraceae bacterium]|nr:glycosyltransferase [Oscillospiraceae bacterium]
MDKLISIIIPVYNVEDYLDDCIESVVNQTYKSLEILLIDDGSTDNSGKICDEWAGRDKRIVVIHKENGGVAEARNVALDLMKGDYVGFVDADDWCEPTMYETLITTAIDESADIVMCRYYTCHGNSHPEEKKKKAFIDYDTCAPEEAILHILGSDGYFTSVWNKLFVRESIVIGDNIVKMHPELYFGEDEVWLYEVIKNSKRIAFVPMQLYNWRARKGSITQSETITNKQLCLIEAKKQVIALSSCFPGIRDEILADIYSNAYILKRIAYCSGDARIREINLFLNPLKRYFLKAKTISTMRKIKFEMMNAVMLLGLPSTAVLKLSRMSRQ